MTVSERSGHREQQIGESKKVSFKSKKTIREDKARTLGNFIADSMEVATDARHRMTATHLRDRETPPPRGSTPPLLPLSLSTSLKPSPPSPGSLRNGFSHPSPEQIKSSLSPDSPQSSQGPLDAAQRFQLQRNLALAAAAAVQQAVVSQQQKIQQHHHSTSPRLSFSVDSLLGGGGHNKRKAKELDDEDIDVGASEADPEAEDLSVEVEEDEDIGEEEEDGDLDNGSAHDEGEGDAPKPKIVAPTPLNLHGLRYPHPGMPGSGPDGPSPLLAGLAAAMAAGNAAAASMAAGLLPPTSMAPGAGMFPGFPPAPRPPGLPAPLSALHHQLFKTGGEYFFLFSLL